jgi:hypothetical protein
MEVKGFDRLSPNGMNYSMMDDLDLNQILWILAGAFLLLGAGAALAGHRRNRRRDVDRPGLVPWQLIEIRSFFLAFGAGMLALRL